MQTMKIVGQTPHYFGFGLQCLTMSHKKDARLIMGTLTFQRKKTLQIIIIIIIIIMIIIMIKLIKNNVLALKVDVFKKNH